MKDGVINLIVGLYFILSQIIAFVFWVQIIRTDHLLYACTLGILEAEFKGIFWIFFIW